MSAVIEREGKIYNCHVRVRVRSISHTTCPFRLLLLLALIASPPQLPAGKVSLRVY